MPGEERRPTARDRRTDGQRAPGQDDEDHGFSRARQPLDERGLCAGQIEESAAAAFPTEDRGFSDNCQSDVALPAEGNRFIEPSDVARATVLEPARETNPRPQSL